MAELDRLIGVLQQADYLKEQLAAAEELQAKAVQRELVVSVMGQFKRGKSSLINALLGEALLPVGIIPLTTVVTELRYGPDFRAEVCFADGRTEPLGQSELADYCSEQRNPGNQKGARAVRITTPRQPFGPGVVLVDTPGVGSVHRHNTDSTCAYVEHSDAVLFLLSVDSPVSEIERDFLLQVRDYAARFFFAVNKADLVPEEDLRIFLDFCGPVLSECLGSPVELLPVSAADGRGMTELKEKLTRELSASHDGLLAASVEKKAALIVGQARAKLTLALRAAALPGAELEKRLDRIRAEQTTLSGFSEEVAVLARHRTDRMVESVRMKLEAKAAEILSEALEEGKRLYGRLQELPVREFEQQLRDELDRFLRLRLAELDREGLALLEEGYVEIAELLNRKAVRAGQFLSDMLQQEFGLHYPVEEYEVRVSSRSDFTLHLGAGGSLLLDTEALSRLLPRRVANERSYRRSMEQVKLDVERNTNSMVSNYRYKMQESLRPLCRELSQRVEGMAGELTALAEHLSVHCHDAEIQRRQEEQRLTGLLARLEPDICD